MGFSERVMRRGAEEKTYGAEERMVVLAGEIWYPESRWDGPAGKKAK